MKLSVYLTKRPGLSYHQKKSLHSILHCQECLKNYKSTLAKFPVKGPLLKLKAEQYGLMKEKVLQDVTNKTISSLDR